MVTATLLKSPLPDEAPKLEGRKQGFSDPIQHFGSALNINIRVQALFPNVVYVKSDIWLNYLFVSKSMRLAINSRRRLRDISRNIGASQV